MKTHEKIVFKTCGIIFFSGTCLRLALKIYDMHQEKSLFPPVAKYTITNTGRTFIGQVL